jgi:hypothetical protein
MRPANKGFGVSGGVVVFVVVRLRLGVGEVVSSGNVGGSAAASAALPDGVFLDLLDAVIRPLVDSIDWLRS